MTKSAIFEKLALNAPHLTTRQLIPALVYGTAWKGDATAELVYQAVCHGFTGVDTANQPKHYREDLVGVGLNRAIAERKVTRGDIYLQTKFTPISGQDPKRVPYNPAASISEQVTASVESSLGHFSTGHDEDANIDQLYVDAVLLHSPLPTLDETMDAWRTLESYVPRKIHSLGVSNCDMSTLMDIYERSTIKPAVVQNRFYPTTRFDIGLRRYCQERGIVYQAFWTLTANPGLVRSVEVRQLAERLRISPPAALYCLVLGLNYTVILDGTTNSNHMREDLAAIGLARQFAVDHEKDWASLLAGFRRQIGQPNE